MALSNLDWYHLAAAEAVGAYTGTGTACTMAANRLSFTFGLRGPSVTVDTACSSSLTALRMALTALRAERPGREALVGSTELMHGPNPLLLRSAAGMLSPEGRCKTFNATADGYARGEGCGALLLVPEQGAASHARLDSVALGQDGRSATLTAPNGPAQEAMLLEALGAAGLQEQAVGCVECHGTGTALGDPIEVGALLAVFRAAEAPRVLLGAGSQGFQGYGSSILRIRYLLPRMFVVLILVV